MKRKLNRYKLRALKFLHLRQSFVVILVLLFILFAVFVRISMLGSLPLDEAYLNKESSNIKAINFNDEAIEQIKALRESNVTAPGTELPQDRQNPFSE